MRLRPRTPEISTTDSNSAGVTPRPGLKADSPACALGLVWKPRVPTLRCVEPRCHGVPRPLAARPARHSLFASQPKAGQLPVMRYRDHANAVGGDAVHDPERVSLRLAEAMTFITSRRSFRMQCDISHRSLDRSLKSVRCTLAAGFIPAERICIFSRRAWVKRNLLHAINARAARGPIA